MLKLSLLKAESTVFKPDSVHNLIDVMSTPSLKASLLGFILQDTPILQILRPSLAAAKKRERERVDLVDRYS